MDPIEEKIAPLVEALNNSGYFTTYSSCEGHFGLHDPHRFDDREKAEVRFEPIDGIADTTIESFFAQVLTPFLNSSAEWKATFDISKKYIPNPDADIEYDYVFTIKPFNPYESNDKKRKHVDSLIKEITESVRRMKLL